MADTNYRSGDTEPVLLRKILQTLNGQSDASVGADVNVTGGSLSITGTAAVEGNVGGFSDVVQSGALTVSGGAFAQYDCVGGIQNTAFFRTGKTTGILSSVTVLDLDNQKAALDLYLFRENPSASTFTNSTTVSLNSADRDKLIGKVSLVSGDYVNLTSAIAVATLGSIGLPIEVAAAGNLYWALVTTGTPTYTSGVMHVALGVLQD